MRLLLYGVEGVDPVGLEGAAAVDGHLEEPGADLLRLVPYADLGLVGVLEPVQRGYRAVALLGHVSPGTASRDRRGRDRRHPRHAQSRGSGDEGEAAGRPPAYRSHGLPFLADTTRTWPLICRKALTPGQYAYG